MLQRLARAHAGDERVDHPAEAEHLGGRLWVEGEVR